MLTISRAVSVTTNEHRAAWDATISAPKSVSLAALVGGDGRIRDAHRESIKAKFRACRVSRAVRMVKESLRPETIQLSRCKEFFRPQVTV
jgi:conjugative relaxase-like TrwC/TraI family protein